MASKGFKITYGGWYQRTTLHLSEVYYFFTEGKSNLNLSKEKLKELQKSLNLESATREPGFFEYVRAVTGSGIEIRYYEDGLYILEKNAESFEDIERTSKEMEEYFNTKLNPGISYIFSLGAPTPKELANIKTVHPVAISTVVASKSFALDEELFGKVYSKISSENMTVYKTSGYIFVASNKKESKNTRDLIEMQIFFREFKDQLEKYLQIHRNIWEEISSVKESKIIRGKDVDQVRGRLDNYQKTINLISNRINQMGSYVSTRSSLAKNLEIEKHLVILFEYKFETLTDSLNYIKEIWKMTGDYLASAINNLVEIKNQSTSNNIKTLQTITSIGVISGLIGYLSAAKLPSLSRIGVVYFIILFVLTWFMNYVILKRYQNKKYSLKFGDRAENL